jgi:exodeoxyribonuclease VII small subunit
MGKKETELNFEEKLEALEGLTSRMEDGKLSLEELLKAYEQGIVLANSLKSDLDKAQSKLLELKGGSLKPAEDA